ncbi:MAG: hypothetical protein LUH47_05615 [Clostridiales bacterium]|nr:hypothetical protein [Clostridiales bacterium]
MSLWENIKQFFTKTNSEPETVTETEEKTDLKEKAEAENSHIANAENKTETAPVADTEANTEVVNPQNDIDAFIKFCVAEDREKRIALGKRQDNYFICFKNEALSGFLFDWYGIMKSRINNETQEDLYVQFLGTICKKYISNDKSDIGEASVENTQ